LFDRIEQTRPEKSAAVIAFVNIQMTRAEFEGPLKQRDGFLERVDGSKRPVSLTPSVRGWRVTKRRENRHPS